jgi:DNA-directed RNA polymerase specialized sigma24 family protein
MNTNKYAGIMDDWQGRMINARARRAGLNSHDRDDAAQQIAIETAAFTSSPKRSDAESEEAVLATIVKRQLQDAARRAARHRRRMERLANENGAARTEFDPKHEMQVDVRAAVEQLPPLQQRVCAMLAKGESITNIAKALNCGWHTVERIIASIREHFQEIGLNDWLGG